MRWVARIVLVAATTLLAAVPSSFAQGEGVTIDPDSPSGKEYALPLESIRRQADPHGPKDRVVQGTRSSPLFGEGIVPPRGTANSSKPPGSGQGAGTATPKSGTGADPVPLPASVAATRPGAPDGGSGTSILVLGVGVLVVGIGTLGGLLLRRRSRSV